jgi:hypothetical protein
MVVDLETATDYELAVDFAQAQLATAGRLPSDLESGTRRQLAAVACDGAAFGFGHCAH